MVYHIDMRKYYKYIYSLLLVFVILLKLGQFQINQRQLLLIPFINFFTCDYKVILFDIIANILIFIPFGILFGKDKYRLINGILFSFSMEIIQYIFAIGITDITDVISNSIGLIIGLFIYNFLSKKIKEKTLNILIDIMMITSIIIIGIATVVSYL